MTSEARAERTDVELSFWKSPPRFPMGALPPNPAEGFVRVDFIDALSDPLRSGPMLPSRLLAVVLVLVACGETPPSGPAPTGAASTAPPVAAPAPTPVPPPPAITPPPAALPTTGTPEDVYAAARAAYARGDADAYFGAFADTLVCFHGRADVPRADVEAGRREVLTANRDRVARGPDEASRVVRIESLEVRRARESADEVELIDHGWTGRSAYGDDVAFHAKRILLRREGSSWRIVAEGPASAADCGLPALTVTAPPLWTAMRDGWAALLAQCDGPPGATMEDGFPGVGGSNGCMPEVNITPTSVCEAMGTPDAACRARALSALEAFVGEGMYGEQ